MSTIKKITKSNWHQLKTVKQYNLYYNSKDVEPVPNDTC